MKILGFLIVAVGAVVFLGNVTGLLRTMPFLGWLLIVAGMYLAQKRPVK